MPLMVWANTHQQHLSFTLHLPDPVTLAPPLALPLAPPVTLPPDPPLAPCTCPHKKTMHIGTGFKKHMYSPVQQHIGKENDKTP